MTAGPLLPLTRSHECDSEDAVRLKGQSPQQSFPNARSPEAAQAALLLLHGCWEASHNLIDDSETPEGCYVHAIVHRIEPDIGNSGYWFRLVGQHPIFPNVHERAKQILKETPISDWKLKPSWDPYLFNEWCEEARCAPGGDKEKVARAIQQAEWDLLYAWCASPRD